MAAVLELLLAVSKCQSLCDLPIMNIISYTVKAGVGLCSWVAPCCVCVCMSVEYIYFPEERG